MEDLGLWVEGWGPDGWEHKPRKGGAPKGGALKGGAPKGGSTNLEKVGPRRVGAPKGGGPKFRAFFSLSRHNFHSFSLSLGVFSCLFSSLSESSRGILVVFWSVGPPGVSQDSLRAKTSTFEVPRQQN